MAQAGLAAQRTGSSAPLVSSLLFFSSVSLPLSLSLYPLSLPFFPSPMKFLKLFRRRSKSSRHSRNAPGDHDHQNNYSPPPPASGYDVTRKLPREVVAHIFTLVCPHVADASFNSSEESMTEDGCMPCDMRDLAHCALVCKRWYLDAHQLL